MKPDEGADPPTELDPYATRALSPDSFQQLENARAAASEDFSKTRGVSRAELDRGLLEGGFLDPEGFQTILAGLETEGNAVDSETLARHLLQVGKLTRYQASALFQGKGRSLLIGPYVVLDKLGSGGMGMVFKARLRKGGPEVALKLLPPSASKHPNAVLRFRREAEIMEKLNHPNLVASHEIGQYGGVHYLVMDYIEGRDLDRVVSSGGPMKLSRAVDCILQAARGLAAAHERGIVHRDVKPANLLLDLKGNVRVLDLGLARITQGDDSIKDSLSAPSLTASGIIMGTVDFLPPEQSDDSKRADHRADIYALACTLYYLLTGRPPYTGDTIMQRLLAHHNKPIPSLGAGRPEVPPEIDSIYRKMMAKAPEDRPQSIVEVIDALESWRMQSSGGKGLRVFNKPRNAKPPALGPKPETMVRQPQGVSEGYELMSFVREALLTPDVVEEATSPPPILPRKTKKRRNWKHWADLATRGLVAAAALVVLVRFFPRNLFNAKATTAPVNPAPVNPAPAVVDKPLLNPDPPTVVNVAPKPRAEPPTTDVLIPKAFTVPAADPTRPPGVREPGDPGPSPSPSRLEELMRPPPTDPGLPGSNPRNGPAPKKKGQTPPRGPGSP